MRSAPTGNILTGLRDSEGAGVLASYDKAIDYLRIDKVIKREDMVLKSEKNRAAHQKSKLPTFAEKTQLYHSECGLRVQWKHLNWGATIKGGPQTLQQFEEEFLFVPHADTFESQAQCRAWLFLRARYVVARWLTELYHSRDGSSRRLIPSDPAAAESELEHVRTALRDVLGKLGVSPVHCHGQENTEEDTAGCSSSTSSTVRVHPPPTRATSTSDMDTMVEDNEDTGATARR